MQGAVQARMRAAREGKKTPYLRAAVNRALAPDHAVVVAG